MEYWFVLGLALLWAGLTSGREYSDFIWPIDLFMPSWHSSAGINVWMTIVTRRTQGIYTTNWFFAAATFMVIIVFLTGKLRNGST